MKLVRVLVLAVALVAGGVAAYLALNMRGEPAPAPVAAAPAVRSQDVLVATSDINQGQKLNAENVRWQAWPEDALNPTYISKAQMPDAVDKLKGSIIRSQFVAGEPIRQGKLARPESGYLSAILPEGKRAIAVRISADTTAGGFILPNDRVDVVKTAKQQGSSDGETVSSTILTNVKVLAIDQTVEDQKSAQSPEGSAETVVVGKTATLELDPTQVELITAAEASGALSLALRSMADTDEATMARDERPSGSIRVFRSGRSSTVTTQ